MELEEYLQDNNVTIWRNNRALVNTKLKVYQKETLLNLMAQSDEEVAALLNEYKELTGSSFQK